MIAFSRNDF